MTAKFIFEESYVVISFLKDYLFWSRKYLYSYVVVEKPRFEKKNNNNLLKFKDCRIDLAVKKDKSPEIDSRRDDP